MELRPHGRERHRRRHLPTTRQTQTAASRHNRSITTGNPHADGHTALTTTGISLMTLHRDPMPGDAAGITGHLPDRHGRIVHQTATKADRTPLGDEHVTNKDAPADKHPVILTAPAGASGTDGAQT